MIFNVYGECNWVNIDSGWVVFDGVIKVIVFIYIVNQMVFVLVLVVVWVCFGLVMLNQCVVVEVCSELFEIKDFVILLKDGEIVYCQWINGEIEILFVGSEGSGFDLVVLSEFGVGFVDFYVVYFNVLIIGWVLFGEVEYKKLMGWLSFGQLVYWIVVVGCYWLFDEQFVCGIVLVCLMLSQDKVLLEVCDVDFEFVLLVGVFVFMLMLVLKMFDFLGFDFG